MDNLTASQELKASGGNFKWNDVKKKLPVTFKQFEVIFNNKIAPELQQKDKFLFENLWMLINSYDYIKYENINKSTFGQIKKYEDKAINDNVIPYLDDDDIKPRKKYCTCISDEFKEYWTNVISSP